MRGTSLVESDSKSDSTGLYRNVPVTGRNISLLILLDAVNYFRPR
jgi:hypothetical protein